jgi:Ca2+-binding RTX toxin-like protein
MPATWTVKHGKPDFDFLQTMEDALSTQTIISGGTGNKLVIGGGGNKVIFGGTFTDTMGDPGPEIGTVHTIKVKDHGTLVATATGFNIPVDDIGHAFDNLPSFGTFLNAFFIFTDGFTNPYPGRVTVNLSDDRDVFQAPGGGGYEVHGNAGNDKLTGAGGSDAVFPAVQNKLYGDVGNDKLYGGDGYAYDKLVGGDGNDRLDSGKWGDILRGGDGRDDLLGGAGDDLMTGGSGKDEFFFMIGLGNGVDEAGVDTITDFQTGKDTVVLRKSVFTGIGNHLSAGEFHVGANAEDNSDRILYKASTGALFFDPDGDGGVGKTKFAILENKPDLSHDDFFMV